MQDELSNVIIDAANEVHRLLGGPGLLENIYIQLLTHLRLSSLKFGLLINFGKDPIKDGIYHVVNRAV